MLLLRGKNMHRVSLPAAILAGLLCFGAQAQTAAPTIKIGLIVPLTGGSSDMGNSARVGAQVALDEINDVGGYLGRKFELVVRDDKADPDAGLKHAQELV